MWKRTAPQKQEPDAESPGLDTRRIVPIAARVRRYRGSGSREPRHSANAL